MDLRLFGRVLWRYRYLVVAGWILACMLAFFSFVKVSSEGLSYRQSETYSAIQDVYVTERGFAEGRTIVGDPLDPDAPAGDGVIRSDPARLAALTTLYVQIINSDPVWRIVLEDGEPSGEVVVDQFTDASGRAALPVVRITGLSDTPERAIETAERQTAGFQEYLRLEQDRADIKPADRVVLTTLREANTAELVEGRSLTVPFVIFIAVMGATIALALLLHNLRTSAHGRQSRAAWSDLSPDDIIAADADRVRVPGDDPPTR